MVGKKIKEIRQLKNITQKALGDFLGYTVSHISYIESGARKINIDDLKKIAKFFDVPFDFFRTSETSNFVNFRYDPTTNEIIDKNLIEDFKKFAQKSIYGNNKNQRDS